MKPVFVHPDTLGVKLEDFGPVLGLQLVADLGYQVR
jgi:hypothetical protein